MHRRGRVGGKGRPVRLSFQDPGQNLGDVAAVECPFAGEHLVEKASERPDIGALVDRPAGRLLGAHVGGGAQDHAGRGGCRRRKRRRLRAADGA
jgi:hypothetical protein